jgi:hypothetical protein
VVGALDHAAAAIKELVCYPFEWNAEMRAIVLIEINFPLLPDRKQLAPSQIKALAASVGNVSKGAEVELIR